MKQSLKNKVFFWLPRVLGIVFIVFLGIFAFDVFVPGQPWWYIMAAFLIHLLPNYILLIALVVAWSRIYWLGNFRYFEKIISNKLSSYLCRLTVLSLNFLRFSTKTAYNEDM